MINFAAVKQAMDSVPKKMRSPSGLKVKPGTTKLTLMSRIKMVPLGAKIAVGAGAAALAVFGVAAAVPVAISGAAVGGYYVLRRGKPSANMNGERTRVYQQALSLKDPDKLRTLAVGFEEAGCMKEAEHLLKRAALRERPAEEQQADRTKYREGMEATDSKSVSELADYFADIGADGAAENLHLRAKALRVVGK